jgi:hypothetical protein
MRKFGYRCCTALAIVGVLLHGESVACEPPAGFVNPPRPALAPLEELVSHTEQMDIARGLAVVMQAASRPLQEIIRPTKELPGVRGTFDLKGPFGTPGSRRLVCLTDGSLAVEEVLDSEVNPDNRRFRYVVWNYTSRTFRAVDYAVGEFIYTQPASDKTHVNWTYRFALKNERGIIDESRFRKSFLERHFAEWMRSVLELKRSTAEAAP